MADEQQQSGSMMERLRNSPRTVSTIIVILIIAGAIFAFSDRGTPPSSSAEPTATPVPTASASPKAGGTATATAKPTAAPKPTQTGEGVTVTAVRGDSVTRLARRAAADYLIQHPAGFTVTNEDRIFIEDYLKDRQKRAPLAVNGTRTFRTQDMQNAVAGAKNLTASQRKQLTKYASRVNWQNVAPK